MVVTVTDDDVDDDVDDDASWTLMHLGNSVMIAMRTSVDDSLRRRG